MTLLWGSGRALTGNQKRGALSRDLAANRPVEIVQISVEQMDLRVANRCLPHRPCGRPRAGSLRGGDVSPGAVRRGVRYQNRPAEASAFCGLAFAWRGSDRLS